MLSGALTRRGGFDSCARQAYYNFAYSLSDLMGETDPSAVATESPSAVALAELVSSEVATAAEPS